MIARINFNEMSSYKSGRGVTLKKKDRWIVKSDSISFSFMAREYLHDFTVVYISGPPPRPVILKSELMLRVV